MFRGPGVVFSPIGGCIATLQVASQAWRMSDKRVCLSAIILTTTGCCRILDAAIRFVTAATILHPWSGT